MRQVNGGEDLVPIFPINSSNPLGFFGATRQGIPIGKTHHLGLLLAAVEGFGLWQKTLLPVGQKIKFYSILIAFFLLFANYRPLGTLCQP